MTAVAERTAVVMASFFGDVVHVIDELGPAIPTRLNVTGGPDVVVRTRDMRAVRRPALGYVGRHLVAMLFLQREERLRLVGVSWMHRNVEAKGRLSRIASDGWLTKFWEASSLPQRGLSFCCNA